MKLIKSLLTLTAITIFTIACTQTETTNTVQNENTNKAENTKTEPTATPDELASGRKIYKEQCAKCHKDDGIGGEIEVEGKKIKPDNLTTDKMKKMSDEKYINYIVKGIPDEGMPAFKDILSDEEIKDVVNYIRKEIQK